MNWFKHLTNKFKKKDELEAQKEEPKVEIPKDVAPTPLESQSAPLPAREIEVPKTLEKQLKKKEDARIKLAESEEEEYPILPESDSDEPVDGYLVSEEKIQICQRIAMFWSSKQIKKWASDELGKNISDIQLNHYKKAKKWKPVVARYRSEFLQRVGDIPLANKIKRVEELVAAYKRLKLLEERQEADRNKQSFIREERETLAQIQEEVEGKKNQIMAGDIFVTQFNNMNWREAEQHELKLISRMKELKKKEEQDAEKTTETN